MGIKARASNLGTHDRAQSWLRSHKDEPLAMTVLSRFGVEPLVCTASVRRPKFATATQSYALQTPRPPLDELRDQLDKLFTTYDGNVTQVARFLGKARVQIQRWCRYCDINPASYHPTAR